MEFEVDTQLFGVVRGLLQAEYFLVSFLNQYLDLTFEGGGRQGGLAGGVLPTLCNSNDFTHLGGLAHEAGDRLVHVLLMQTERLSRLEPALGAPVQELLYFGHLGPTCRGH